MVQKRRPARAAEASITRPGIWKATAAWAALVAATLLAYTPALNGGLVWDDANHITAPSLQSLHGLWRIWFDLGATQQYYPLLHSAFWIEHRLWGDQVLGYHLTNVLLHALTAGLLVLIVKRLSLPGAWLAGFIFALHPACVEAVAWISEQKSTLSGLFYMAAALTYLNFDRTRRKGSYIAATGLFVLALMSKSVTATLPAALLVLLWWMHTRLDFRRDVLPLLPWFGLAVPAGLFTSWVERTYIGAQGSDFALTLPQRFLLAGRVPWFYASEIVWPAGLVFSYPKWKIDSGEWWQYLFPAGLAAVALALALLSRRNRGPMAAFLIFGGTLFPVLGFLNVFPFRYSYVADHFQYLAMPAIIVPLTAWLSVATRGTSRGMVAILPIVLALLTWQQSGAYRDEETLYRRTLARNPGSYFVHLELGNLLFLTHERLPEAATEFEAAARVKPDSAEAHMNLGNALAEMPGKTLDAIAEFRDAIRYRPDFADAHDNLGLALASIPGRDADAIAEYRTALRIEPNFWEAHANLGLMYARTQDRRAAAVSEFQEALRINPASASTHFSLGNALQQMGRLPDAIGEYRAALRTDPELAEAHYELAYSLAQIPGRIAEAIAECQEMLRIRPDDKAGQQLMTSLLAMRDRGGPPRKAAIQ